MALEMKCKACCGTGKRSITKTYLDTYNLVKANPCKRSRDYAGLAGVGYEVMYNRLAYLLRKGWLKTEGYMMERTWRVAGSNEPVQHDQKRKP